MGNNGRQLQHKDEDGLTLIQRRTLQELALTPNFKQAAENAEVPVSTVKHWLATDEAFSRQYDKLLGSVVEVSRRLMEANSQQAAEMYGEAVEADKTLYRDVTCPECQHEFTVRLTVPNWPTRLRAGEVIQRVSGLLKNVQVHEGTLTHLTLEESLALALWKQDKQIPPQMVDRLRQKGMLRETDSD